MGSSKIRIRKAEGKAGKLIRLKDLIPPDNISGGRRTIFGSPPLVRRKPQK